MTDPHRPEIPVSEGDEVALEWGSDVVAEMLRRLDIEYISLNPGASFRGFHDSLVNYLGNHDPQILLCLHEDHSVAIAQGYAKASGKPMAVALHANVGLMHALLGIFNAWCDRMPMLLIGANGPVDTTMRRPWMDWLHTHKDQGALLRHSVKWDDEPRSCTALVESLLRAAKLMRTAPQGPVYVCVDGALQETRLPQPFELPSVQRYQAAQGPGPSPQEVEQVAAALAAARRPMILAGRCSRSQVAWDNRLRLAELSGARVGTDLKSGAAFPTDHPLHLPGLTLRISDQVLTELRNADLVLLLDWIDTASLFQAAGKELTATIINCSLDSYLHSGASMEHFGLAPVDIDVLADPDSLVAELLPMLDRQLNGIQKSQQKNPKPNQAIASNNSRSDDEAINTSDIGHALDTFRPKHEITLARVPIGWDGDCYAFTGPLDFLGYDGGGGLSSGPGNTIGSALALRDSRRVVVGILGDGDFLQATSALWTAARYGIPALFIIANNRSNYTDVRHQQNMARTRGRPLANSGIGQHIEEPSIDIAALARAQGVAADGPIESHRDLLPALEKAFKVIAEGRPYLIDVIVVRE
jgi:thiamine pyrophosphate-dependent acetolactate synthase large subunit-like protein